MLAMITAAEARLLVTIDRLRTSSVEAGNPYFSWHRDILESEAAHINDLIEKAKTQLIKKGKDIAIKSLAIGGPGVIYDLTAGESTLIKNLRILKQLRPKTRELEKMTSRVFEFWAECELQKIGIDVNEYFPANTQEEGQPCKVIDFARIKNKRSMRAAYMASV